MKLKEITDYFDIVAPPSGSADWDNDGVMIYSGNDDVERILITLDADTDAINRAIETRSDLILTHHPLIFRPIKRIGYENYSRNIRRLIKNEISVLSYHTRMDCADKGINNYIMESIGAEDIRPFGLSPDDRCGRIGRLIEKTTVDELCRRLKELFGCDRLLHTRCGDEIRTAAVVSGGGSDYIDAAFAAGADVFISGDFHHHHYVNALIDERAVICVDHYHCENVFVDLAEQLIKVKFPKADIVKNYGSAPTVTI